MRRAHALCDIPAATRQDCNIVGNTAFSTTHCDTVQYSATHCNTVQHSAAHCNTVRRIATQCGALQHSVAHCNIVRRIATQCGALQHRAAHCNTVWRIATVCGALQPAGTPAGRAPMRTTPSTPRTTSARSASIGSPSRLAARLSCLSRSQVSRTARHTARHAIPHGPVPRLAAGLSCPSLSQLISNGDVATQRHFCVATVPYIMCRPVCAGLSRKRRLALPPCGLYDHLADRYLPSAHPDANTITPEARTSAHTHRRNAVARTNGRIPRKERQQQRWAFFTQARAARRSC